MKKTYVRHTQIAATPQMERTPGRTDEVENNAGGFVFGVDKWVAFDRFLILGSEGGTYYASEKDHTVQATDNLIACVQEDGVRVVNRIVEISDAGRAPKNTPALFALAYAAKRGDDATRRAAFSALPKVARIETHLAQFTTAMQAVSTSGNGGWSRGARTAVGGWLNRDVQDVAYQAIKYRQREGWTLADMLRLSHPKPASAAHRALFQWIVDGVSPANVEGLEIIEGFEQLQKATTGKAAAAYIRKYNLPREAVPTTLLNDIEVWDALLERMPMTAMVRNLAKMTNIGLIKPMSDAAKKVVAELGNIDRLRKARVHPIALLSAEKVYQQGHGVMGNLSWTPVPQIVDALDSAFYAAFGTIEPTGKNYLLGLDVSASMGGGYIAGVQCLTPGEGAAVMAMVTMKVEKNYAVMAFDQGIRNLPLSPKMRLDDVLERTVGINGGGTDCSLPMQYAQREKLKVDTFVVLTDNETWAGNIKPVQALERYRQAMSVPARLIVCGMTATDFTIADPKDRGMLDVVGMDTATPQLISSFSKGEF